MSILIFDADKSLSAIGGESQIIELFGLPPIKINKGLEEARKYLKGLIQIKKTISKHPVFENLEFEEEHRLLSNNANKFNLNTLVFDTITAMGLQEREIIKRKRMKDIPSLNVLDQQGWGMYADSMNSFIHNICSIEDAVIIVTAHIDPDKDHEGYIIEFPALKGSAKTEAQKWFDVIVYTKIIKDKNKTKYYWITKGSDRKIAKDRKGVLDDVMPQDFSIILKKYQKAGIQYPKILVLGHSGTGKTYSLKTLKGVTNESKS